MVPNLPSPPLKKFSFAFSLAKFKRIKSLSVGFEISDISNLFSLFFAAFLSSLKSFFIQPSSLIKLAPKFKNNLSSISAPPRFKLELNLE